MPHIRYCIPREKRRRNGPCLPIYTAKMSSKLKLSFSIASLIGADDSDNNSRPGTRTTQVSPDNKTSPVCQVHAHPMAAGTCITPPISPTLPEATPPTEITVVPGKTSVSQRGSSDPAIILPANSSSFSDTSGQSEGYSGSSSPESSNKKNVRMSYSSSQTNRLESVFLTTPYPDSQMYETLAEEFNLPAKRLKVWFQNKRARSKRRVSDTRMSNFPPVHPVYMPPMTPAVVPYPYMMPGMLTPPSSPIEMQMMQYPFFTFPTSCHPMMQPGQMPYTTSGSP